MGDPLPGVGEGVAGKGEAAVRRAAAEAGDEAGDEGVDAAISSTGR